LFCRENFKEFVGCHLRGSALFFLIQNRLKDQAVIVTHWAESHS